MCKMRNVRARTLFSDKVLHIEGEICDNAIRDNSRKKVKEPIMFKLRAFLAMNICIAAYVASATTYYVDYDTGSDDNDGLSASTPFKTVKHALDLGSDVLKDGEIVLKSGTHHLNGAPLVKNVYCTIRSETRNPADVTIDARVLYNLPDLGAYELWIEPGTMIIFK